jgi:PKD repeat protein
MEIKHSNNRNMFHRFLRALTCSILLVGVTAFTLTAQPCADTQPTIAGAQVVSNNQTGVIYSTPNIPGHTYSWTATGGIITSVPNTNQVTVNWGIVGIGSVSVTETNPSIPCSTTVTATVKIQPLLVSYFFYTDTSCYGNTVCFRDSSVADPTKPIVSYSINFGDGSPTVVVVNPPSLQFPVCHTFLPPFNVTYTITYIVTNNEGATDTIYDAVYVNPNQYIPTAAFSENIPSCSYQAVTFDGTISTTPLGTTPIERYAWNFGDPASGALNYDSCQTCGIASHIFTGPGTYTVTLGILNEKSCRASITQSVIIGQSVPTARYSFSAPTCENNPVFFTDNSTFPAGKNITSWEWNFGDGSAQVVINAPASPNVSHTFPGLGPYSVQLVVTNNATCNDTATHSVTLTPSPIANYTNSTPCAGDTIIFQNHSVQNNGPSIVSYYWNYGDPASGNNTSFLANGAHVYADSGLYTVTFAIANTTGCPDTIRRTLHVNAKPAVEFTWNIGVMNNQIDFHIDSTITNLGYIGNMCHWNFGDGTYGTGHNPVHTYLGANNWTATLTVTDTLGCSSSVSHIITVPEIPMAFYSSNSPVCLNTPMCFNDLSSVPSPPFGFISEWIWNFGDGSAQDTIHFPNNPNVCHTYTTPGIYSVTLTVTDNSGFTDSYSHDQTVLPLPIANFQFTTGCAGALVQFTDASFPNGGGNIISWRWNFGDPLSGVNDTSALQNPSHIFGIGGVTYNVRLIVENFDGCSDTIIKPVYIFPNPPVQFIHDTACVTELVHFTADTTVMHTDSIVTWSWNFGDGSGISSDPISTSHLYINPGTYIVTLAVVDHHGCINSVSHDVKVNPLPIPQFSWSTPACIGSPVSFTDQSLVPAGYTGYVAKWQWDFGDGTPPVNITLPASPDVIHTFGNISPSHVVTLTVWTSDSCSAIVTHTINSIPAPTAAFSYSPVSCMGQAVQFTDQSQTNGGGSITLWSWNFGDPTSGLNNLSTAENPAHTFGAAGTYSVTLIVNNSTGCMDTIVLPVTVNTLPVANFHADTVCLNNPTQFTDLSVPNATTIISYSWNFGDGSPLINQPSPAHTYSTYGIFTVTLTIVNSNGCTKDTSKQVLVNPLPVAAFSFSSPNCVGAVVNYTNLSTTVPGYLGYIVQWTWNFGDGTLPLVINFPASANVTHTFAGNVLTHLVTLTVKTSDSCVATISHVVTSIPSPVAAFSVSSANCTGQLVQFSDNSQINGGGAIVSWDWNFGDPASGTNNIASGPNPAHSFTGPGTYNVSLIVTNTSGCTDTIVTPVTINQLPLANFTADTVCFGSPTIFTNASLPPLPANIVSYSWDFGDASLPSTLQNPTHTYATYGVFTVTLTVTNSNGCIKDTSKQILVHPLPIAAFTFTTPNCLGAPIQYTNQSTTVPGYTGSIVKWIWNFGDTSPIVTINFPGNPSISHTFFTQATSHLVTLTVVMSDSCSATVSHIVNSNPAPIADFSFPTSNCANQSVQFTDNSQGNGGGNITQWLWNFDDPASGLNNNATIKNPTHNFSAPGVYTVTETVWNASNCSSTDTLSVTIIALPHAKFHADSVCLGSLTTFTDQSSTIAGTITQWSWQFGDGGVSFIKNPTHLYPSSGTWNVTLTVTTQEGCIKDTIEAVLVYPAPIASFTTTAPTCAGDSVCFSDLSSTPHGVIVKWVWDFGDGNSKTINFPANQNVCHFYTNGGNYSVSLTITTSDQCVNTKTSQVVINSAPTANFFAAPTRCTGMPVQFTDNSQPGGGSPINQWLWNFGDPTSGSANTSPLQNPSHSFTHSGAFQVSLMVTNSTGCFDSTSKSVSVNAGPIVNFTADTACVGSQTQFTDASTPPAPATIVSYTWDFGDPSSGTSNTSTIKDPTHIYNAPGVYTVMETVINSNTCTHDTTKQITVSPRPQSMFSATVACVNDSTAFHDLSIAPGSGLTNWFWEFGDGGTSTIENPKHKYTSASTFNVTLTVTNLSGCKDSVTIPVTTHPTPIAAFSYNSFFCPAGEVAFQDQSQGVGSAIVQRQWIFYPGAESSQINPTFTFPVTDTTYLVSLIVTDSYGCMDTVSDSVHVKPGNAFTFRNDTVCFKSTTHFTAIDLAHGDSLYSVTWNFGDPNSGGLNSAYTFNAQHNFTQPGIYVVELKATDSDNCTDSIFHNVTVHALPAPSFSVLSIPCDSVIHFNADTTTSGSGTISSWEWNFGDGSPVLIIPGSHGSGDTSHIYAAQAIYPVTLKVTNSFGCFDTVTKSAELFPCILAQFNHNDTLMCARYNIAFSDSSLPVNIINQWHWTFGDGFDTIYSQHVAVIHHTFAQAGTYDVKLIIHAIVPGSGRAFTDSAKQMIVIHPTPLPGFLNPATCWHQTTQFRDTSNTFGSSTVSWKWIFGESYTGSKDSSTLINPTHKYDSAGTYDVRLVVMNRFGCKDSLIKPTTVYNIPTAIFNHSIACSGKPTYFTDSSQMADTAHIINWVWNFGEVSSDKDTSHLKDPLHQYKTDGDYVVRLIVKDQHGCYDTVDSTVIVHITPVSSFIYSDNINNMTGKLQFTNKSSGADTYFWNFGNGQTSTDANPVVTYSNDGTFLIMLISSNQFNCSDTTYYTYEFIFKGLYIPNAFSPTSLGTGANLFTPVGVNLKQFQIEVFDGWGHMLWSSVALDAQGRPTESWDGKDSNGVLYPSGTYMWKAKATFIDNTIWEGSDIGKGSAKTIGTVTLIR